MNKQTLFTGKFLALMQEGHWEYAQRINATGAAIVVATTADERLLLVEQYRIPCHARTIELPAGITGDAGPSSGESHAEAARRELLEETGYAAQEIEALTTGPSSSGLASEIVTLFRARGLRKIGTGGGVEHEAITVHEIPVAELDDWLRKRERDGALIDPKIYAGLYFLSKESL